MVQVDRSQFFDLSIRERQGLLDQNFPYPALAAKLEASWRVYRNSERHPADPPKY
jgi:hypothetical protein